MSSFEKDPQTRAIASFLVKEQAFPLLEKLISQGAIPSGTTIELKFPRGVKVGSHFSFDRDRRLLEREGSEVRIEPLDGKFLGLLIEKIEEVVTYPEIEELFGRSAYFGSDIGKDSVYRIRNAMRAIGVPNPKKVLVSRPRIGYKLTGN